MLVNYFNQYNMNTDDLQEKLHAISKFKTENAEYVTHIFKNALEFISKPQNLCAENVIRIDEMKEINSRICIFFDNVVDNDIMNEQLKTLTNYVDKMIIIGKHKTRRINTNVICISLQQHARILKEIRNQDRVFFGFNLKVIDNTKYYYNPIKCYFLNICYQLYETELSTIQADTEGTCTNILYNPTNRISHYENDKLNIKLKVMMKLYNKILKHVGENAIEKKMFYTSDVSLSDREINALNTISELIDVYHMKNEDKISYVYDRVAMQMMEEIKQLNYCNFVDNQCVASRYHNQPFPNSIMNGCCNNTYLDKNKNCRFLKEDHSCSICSLSCRVFTCKYLQDRGIDHALWQYPLIDCVIKKLTRSRIVYGFFIPKEKMMQRLKKGFF